MSSTRQTESAEVKSEDPEPRGTSADPVPKVKKRRELGVDPSLIISEERSKRRKTPTPEPEDVPRKDEHDPKDPVRAKQLGMEIYGKVLKMEDNESVSGRDRTDRVVDCPCRSLSSSCLIRYVRQTCVLRLTMGRELSQITTRSLRNP